MERRPLSSRRGKKANKEKFDFKLFLRFSRKMNFITFSGGGGGKRSSANASSASLTFKYFKPLTLPPVAETVKVSHPSQISRNFLVPR